MAAEDIGVRKHIRAGARISAEPILLNSPLLTYPTTHRQSVGGEAGEPDAVEAVVSAEVVEDGGGSGVNGAAAAVIRVETGGGSLRRFLLTVMSVGRRIVRG